MTDKIGTFDNPINKKDLLFDGDKVYIRADSKLAKVLYPGPNSLSSDSLSNENRIKMLGPDSEPDLPISQEQNIDKVSNILRVRTDSRGIAFNRIAEEIDAVYQPRLAALQQRVKELEHDLKIHEDKLVDVQNLNYKRGFQAALESQLKPVIGLPGMIEPFPHTISKAYSNGWNDCLQKVRKALASQESKGGTK